MVVPVGDVVGADAAVGRAQQRDGTSIDGELLFADASGSASGHALAGDVAGHHGVVAGMESFKNTVGLYDPDDTDDTRKALDVALDSSERILVLDPIDKSMRMFVEK